MGEPKEVRYGNKTVMAAQSWNDLNRKQFKAVIKVFGESVLRSDQDLTAPHFYSGKLYILKYLLKIPARKFFRMNANVLAARLYLLDFLYVDKDGSIDLDKQFYPRIRVGGLPLHGPKAKLSGASFQEYITADTYFIKYCKTRDPKMLHHMIAALYRPPRFLWRIRKLSPKWKGDNRSKLNRPTIERRSKWIGRFMSHNKQMAIFYFYWGFRQNNPLKFKNLYEDPAKADEELEKAKVGNDYGWAGVLLEFSGGKFGPLESTENTEWSKVFVEMSRAKDAAMEAERRAKTK